ncbi:MAG: transposase [Candidatus Sulfotelmatobacter sp.]
MTPLTDKTLAPRDHLEMDCDRTFFITTITAQRQPIFRRETTAKLLIDTLAHYRDTGKFRLNEFVIMPDHIHVLMTPAPEISLERAVQFIKGGFSYRLKSRPPVWQASFTNHRVRDPADYQQHQEYIWRNPVRARLAARPEDYPYSSASGVVRLDPVPQGLKPFFFVGGFIAAL